MGRQENKTAMSSLESKYDRLNKRRLELLSKKYLAGGLTDREDHTLERLHMKIEEMAPLISAHILRTMATTPPLILGQVR